VFFAFPEDGRWNAELQAVEFGVVWVLRPQFYSAAAARFSSAVADAVGV
jgi:hypothetical protein